MAAPEGVTVDDVRRAIAAAPAQGGAPVSALPVELPSPSRRPAAVLCAVFDAGGHAAVVLTRRSSRMRSHTGEVSFPGGRIEEREAPVAAALREAREEVGIEPGSVEVIGQLHSLTTALNPAPITPFVGVLGAAPLLRPNPSEVERAFTVPLSELYLPHVYHDEVWADPRFVPENETTSTYLDVAEPDPSSSPGDSYKDSRHGRRFASKHGGDQRLMHFFHLDGDTVWGATARMLVDLLDRVWTVLDAGERR